MQSPPDGVKPDRFMAMLFNLLAQEPTRPTARTVTEFPWTVRQQLAQPMHGDFDLGGRATALARVWIADASPSRFDLALSAERTSNQRFVQKLLVTYLVLQRDFT